MFIAGTSESPCKVAGLGDVASHIAMHALVLGVGNETDSLWVSGWWIGGARVLNSDFKFFVCYS